MPTIAKVTEIVPDYERGKPHVATDPEPTKQVETWINLDLVRTMSDHAILVVESPESILDFAVQR